MGKMLSRLGSCDVNDKTGIVGTEGDDALDASTPRYIFRRILLREHLRCSAGEECRLVS